MKEITVKCYGKINLSLNITGIRDDGFHLLDMIMASVDICDCIKAKKTDKKGITCLGNVGFVKSNSAYKAAEAVCSEFGIDGVELEIEKNIPVSGGLGGSSADAVGIILALEKLFAIHDKIKLNEIANSIGSDISFMMKGGYARVKGIGDAVEFFDCETPLNIVALKPAKGVNSRKCYEQFDEISQPGIISDNNVLQQAVIKNDLFAVAGNLKNMLYKPASTILPEIEKLYKILLSYKPLAVNMSGSGSTVYALMNDENSAAELEKKLKNRFCFCKALKTVNKGIEYIFSE